MYFLNLCKTAKSKLPMFKSLLENSPVFEIATLMFSYNFVVAIY